MIVSSEETNSCTPIILFGRKFLNDSVVGGSHVSPKPKPSLKTQTISSSLQTDKEPQLDFVCKSRPRSCMILVQGTFGSVLSASFSPSHYLYSRHFNGLVCVLSLSSEKAFSEIQRDIIAVAEFLIDEGYSTPTQLGYSISFVVLVLKKYSLLVILFL